MGVRYEMELKQFSYRNPFTFATDISEETMTYITENTLEIPGVSIQSEAVRSYESGEIAPHVIGTMGKLSADDYKKLKTRAIRMTTSSVRTVLRKPWSPSCGASGAKRL